LDDRDFTIHVSWGEDGEGKWLRFSTANELGPGPLPHVIRVMLNEGGWRFYAVEGGRTYAIYQFTLDLGGSMPGWLGRGRAAKDLSKLFDSIRNQTQYYR